MKTRMLLAAGMLALLGGCATYDYTGGASGGYYRGTPSVQYRYPPGYYGGYYGGYGPYYGPGWIGLYDYPAYPGRYYYRPPPVRRPPSGNAGPRPPRPSQPAPPRPSVPRQSSPSPWRDLNRIKQPGRSGVRTQEP
ncbi:hypothetical protein [Pseudomonas sp. Hp2]|jgi:hypothetical protein|uniref:hypothetical protein n=1 Tax=Pseudomonas sp. Hp2 TaxID=701189 RepID=UPI001C4990EB|nr:hypothetical protein [Pseudomonas sp. Hp2]